MDARFCSSSLFLLCSNRRAYSSLTLKVTPLLTGTPPDSSPESLELSSSKSFRDFFAGGSMFMSSNTDRINSNARVKPTGSTKSLCARKKKVIVGGRKPAHSHRLSVQDPLCA